MMRPQCPACRRQRFSLSASRLLLGVLLCLWAQLLSAAPFAYVPNKTSNTVSVLDTASNTVTATFSSSLSQPYGVVVHPSGTHLYLTNTTYPNSNVLVVNAATGVAETAILDSYINQPRGIAVNPAGTYLYVANFGSNRLSVIDVDPGSATVNTLLTSIAGFTQPEGVAVHPLGHVYVANSGSTTVAMVPAGSSSILTNIGVGSQPKAIAISQDGARAYVTNNAGNTLSVLNVNPASGVSYNTVIATVTGFSSPYGVAVTPDGSKVYVTNIGTNSVSVVDPTAHAIIGSPIGVGNSPMGIDLGPDGTHAYVANSMDGTVSVIDTATDSVVATVAVGFNPIALGRFMGPAVTLSANSLDFIAQLVGTTSAAQTVTLSNHGASSITISSVLLTGDTADFVQTNNCGTLPATLNAGSSCTFSITFAPTVATARSTSLQITTTAPNSPHVVALSGSGTTAGGGGGGGGGCTVAATGAFDPALLALACGALFGLLKRRRAWENAEQARIRRAREGGG